jgi:hypothetical protein
MKQLGQQQLTARAWAFSGTPGPIRLRIGSHDFALDRAEAVELASQLVDAADQLHEAAQ